MFKIGDRVIRRRNSLGKWVKIQVPVGFIGTVSVVEDIFKDGQYSIKFAEKDTAGCRASDFDLIEEGPKVSLDAILAKLDESKKTLATAKEAYNNAMNAHTIARNNWLNAIKDI